MRLSAHHLSVDGQIGFVQDSVPERPNGSTLLLVHTAGQSGVQWRYSLPILTRRGYRVVVPDLPGHGHSEPAVGGPVTDLRWYADWLMKVADSLVLEDLFLVGCSIGGKIVQDLACRHSRRLTGAISMCAEAGRGRGKLHALHRELEDSAAPSRSDRTHLGTRAVVGHTVPNDRAALIARMHCREDPVISISDLIGWCTHDVRDRLSDIRCPITFVAGQNDLWVDANAVKWAAEQVSGAAYVFLEGYGHYPMEEMDDFGNILDAWVRDMTEGAR